MGLFGSIAGGALGAVGSIFGGISASKAMKKVKRNIEAQKKANEDWYNRRYNEDATQRADAQRILTMTEESIKNRNKQAAATAAVMGGYNAPPKTDRFGAQDSNQKTLCRHGQQLKKTTWSGVQGQGGS